MVERTSKGQFKKGHTPWWILKGVDNPWHKDKFWKNPERNKKISKKISKYNKIRDFSEKTRNKLRKSSINYLKNKRDIRYPCIGKHEKHILNILEQCFGEEILRQHNVNGYFLDGYCPRFNLAIEINEKRHKKQKQKDMIRQKEIRESLNCQFLNVNLWRGD